MTPTTLTGKDARDLIESQLDQYTGGIIEALRRFEPVAAVDVWFQTLRAIEELINLPGELDDAELAKALFDLSLRPETIEPRRLKSVLQQLGSLYGPAVVQR